MGLAPDPVGGLSRDPEGAVSDVDEGAAPNAFEGPGPKFESPGPTVEGPGPDLVQDGDNNDLTEEGALDPRGDALIELDADNPPDLGPGTSRWSKLNLDKSTLSLRLEVSKLFLLLPASGSWAAL